MKRSIPLLILVIIAYSSLAQKRSGVLKDQKDGWGISYTYAGEITDGKPNGWGMAIYDGSGGSDAIRYGGQFKDGMFNGKGTILYEDGSFYSCKWKDGLPKFGATVTPKGSFYLGEMNKGEKEGKGVYVSKDNSCYIGAFANDNVNGRNVYIPASGKYITDAYYTNGVINGKGYQFEAESNTLFKGEWDNGKWLASSYPGFSSFLSQQYFKGGIDEDNIYMGILNGTNHLIDSSFRYILKDKIRYFGYHRSGFLYDGLIIEDDKSRFIGKMENDKYLGQCYRFNMGKSYSEGYYSPNGVTADFVSINLEKKTIFYGQALDGVITGTGVFFNSYNEMSVGDFTQGKLKGFGYKVDQFGKTINGVWENGNMTKVNSIETANGETIKADPGSFSEAMNIVIKEYLTHFNNLQGAFAGEESSTKYYESYLEFPGSTISKVVHIADTGYAFIPIFIQTTDENAARRKYAEIADKIQETSVSNKYFIKPAKLIGKVNPVISSDYTKSTFTLNPVNPKYKKMKVLLEFTKENDQYFVSISVTD